MNRRGCLIVVGVLAGLLLICCLLGIFVVRPRIQDAAVDGISQSLSTEIANQVESAPGTLDPGTYTIPLTELEEEVNRELAAEDGASDFVMTSDGDTIKIGISANGQDLNYTGRPVVENGELQIEGMKSNNSAIDFIMPGDKVAEVIEKAFNDYLASRGLQLESISFVDGEITFTAVPAES